MAHAILGLFNIQSTELPSFSGFLMHLSLPVKSHNPVQRLVGRTEMASDGKVVN